MLASSLTRLEVVTIVAFASVEDAWLRTSAPGVFEQAQ
jgi:hypothetical protein